MEPGERTGGRQDGNSNRRGKIGDRGLVRAVNVVTYPTLSSRHRTGQKEQGEDKTGTLTEGERLEIGV